MRGPFVLSKSCVNLVVPPNMRGVYGLSNSKDTMELVKRATGNANEEIKSYFNQYKYFWFELAASPREAFMIECELYHSRLVARNNGVKHPAAPADSGWRCPVCGQ